MNILYVHGFASRFDSSSQKVQALKTIGEVSGVNIDYSMPVNEIESHLYKAILDNDIDLLVGTSMGGYYSALLGAKCGIPFIAINPATEPRTSLARHLGAGTTFDGADYFLTEVVVSGYEPIVNDSGACGLILLDEGDEILDSAHTHDLLKSSYCVKVFKDGCHRFSHINESLEDIRMFYNRAELVYGLDND